VPAKGFDPSLTTGNANITRKELDAIAPNNPVFMLNASGHLAYVNSKAIEIAGVTDTTPDPPAGGRYFKDANGKLTGQIAGGTSYAPFVAKMPRADAAALVAAATRELDMAASKGCTMLVDAGLGSFAGPDELPILKSIVESGRASVRLAAMMTSRLMDKFLAMPGMKPGAGDDRFRLLGFKFWSDGSNQGNTGYLRERYLNVDGRGVLSFPPEELAEGMKRAHDGGWQVAVHANGDAAIDITLDAYEKAIKANPRKDHRHRIEHCSIAWEEHYAKMAALGLTPSFLIGHVHYWGKAFRDRIIGPERAARLGAGQSALKHGVRFSLHSDYDVTEIGPLRCIENAVTRIMRDGGEVLGPDQRIPVDQALRAMTIDAAYQARIDHAVGTIEVGKYADLVVLEEDPMKVDPTRLSQIKVRETWVEGEKRFG
jgi:predicted amidohydrolase YtcJ